MNRTGCRVAKPITSYWADSQVAVHHVGCAGRRLRIDRRQIEQGQRGAPSTAYEPSRPATTAQGQSQRDEAVALSFEYCGPDLATFAVRLPACTSTRATPGQGGLGASAKSQSIHRDVGISSSCRRRRRSSAIRATVNAACQTHPRTNSRCVSRPVHQIRLNKPSKWELFQTNQS